MGDDNPDKLKWLTNFYQIQSAVYLAVIILVEIYVIGYRLRFKLDTSGYIIFVTQLFVFASRLFMDRFSNDNIFEIWFQSTLV